MDLSFGIVFAIFAITVIAFVFIYLKIRKAKEEEAKRAQEKEERRRTLLELEPQIRLQHVRCQKVLSFDEGYLMKKDWDALLSEAQPIVSSLKSIPKSEIEEMDFASEALFLIECQDDKHKRESRNEDFKSHELELCDELFSDIDGGHSLDAQQRDAIVTDEYSNLVIAGAGSGKTSVVVGKVKYLVDRWGIKPEEILVTSFTRASVDDLRERIKANGVDNVSARTFHSLGLKALGDKFAMAQDDALSKYVVSYLSNELCNHQDQAAAFLEFFGLQCLSEEESLDNEEAEIRMKILKAQDMRTLKGFVQETRKSNDSLGSLRGEKVKSIEELMIANFLFLNGVEYEYERPYPYEIPKDLREGGRRAYQPDFYLSEYDIWLEHFGIDENGNVPWMKTSVEERSYIDGMIWKRKLHASCNTKLIESYSYWNKDQDLLNKLEKLLVNNGVRLVNDPKRNAEICSSLMRDKRFFSSMAELLSTFVSLAKANNISMTEIDERARGAYQGNGAMWHRYDLFSCFAGPIMEGYKASLESGFKPRIDFDDMINKAAEQIRRDGISENYRYIIVDEYQDISLSRFGLLSAIRDATGAKLMCVGDDWQAIYRFAGSDVTLFTNFGKLVGFYEEMRIEHTYRNSQQLVDAASKFVLKNESQLKKKVISEKKEYDGSPISIVSLDDQKEALLYALESIFSKSGKNPEVKILGRNKRDLERIFPDLKPTERFEFRRPDRNKAAESKFDVVITFTLKNSLSVDIGYMTVHKSKGLQADDVVLIGLNNDRYGFPNMVVDDPILKLLLADSDDLEYAEERRLFYVALTRTKNSVWLVTGTNESNPRKSIFVDELLSDNDEEVALYTRKGTEEFLECPRCGGALLTKIGPNGSEFVGCSNYPFCDKKYSDTRILRDKKRCPKCGGWLTRRTRKDGSGEFFGCTNYPTYCYYTMNLDGTSGGSSRPQKPNTPYTKERSSRQYYHSSSGRGPSSYSERSRTEGFQGNKAKELRCPKCGAPMALRSSRYGQFYGCTRYPNCKGKRNI